MPEIKPVIEFIENNLNTTYTQILEDRMNRSKEELSNLIQQHESDKIQYEKRINEFKEEIDKLEKNFTDINETLHNQTHTSEERNLLNQNLTKILAEKEIIIANLTSALDKIKQENDQILLLTSNINKQQQVIEEINKNQYSNWLHSLEILILLIGLGYFLIFGRR